MGEIELLGEGLPEWATTLAAVFTTLGDFWFLVVVLCTAFLVFEENRPDIAALLGIILGGIGLYRGLKHYFELARPAHSPLDGGTTHLVSETLLESTATVGGYGFPSGHATMATIVYLGLATALDVGTRRQRFAGAFAIISMVSLTRILLSVHYALDVVVGFILGALLIGLVFVLPRQVAPAYRATVAQLVAIPLCGLYFVTSGADTDAIILFAGALILLTGWQCYTLYARVPANHVHPVGSHLELRASTAVIGAGTLGVLLWQYSTVSMEPSSTAILALFAVFLVLSIPLVRVLTERG